LNVSTIDKSIEVVSTIIFSVVYSEKFMHNQLLQIIYASTFSFLNKNIVINCNENGDTHHSTVYRNGIAFSTNDVRRYRWKNIARNNYTVAIRHLSRTWSKRILQRWFIDLLRLFYTMFSNKISRQMLSTQHETPLLGKPVQPRNTFENLSLRLCFTWRSQHSWNYFIFVTY